MWGVTALFMSSVYGGNVIVSRWSGGSTKGFRTLFISLMLIVNHVSAQNEDIEALFPQYKVVSQIQDWNNANNYCATNFGTSLATIRSQEDADAIVAIKNYLIQTVGNDIKVWTGLHESNNYEGGQWEWASGYQW